MRTHAFLLINPRAGAGSPTAEEVADAARALGVEPHLAREGEDPGELARASGAGILGIAGGDGSLAAVAAVAVETGAAFVCVPFGTRNHFARDIGLDRNDPLAALAAFAGGTERRVDVGRVGERLFLNNVSLGIYARLVHRRERRRRRGEALARLKALAAVARHHHTLHATVDGDPVRARVIFVGNNAYELSLFTVGARERLDAGELSLWTAAGWLPTSWEHRTGTRFRIETRRARVRAAIDGEPVVLDTPVDVEIRPRALRLLLPAQRGDVVHDNPEATEDEQEQAQTERYDEEESMRYPSLGTTPAEPSSSGEGSGSPSATRGEGQPDSPDDAEE